LSAIFNQGEKVMELTTVEAQAIEAKVEEVEVKQLADLELALTGGGMGDVAF
jgi:hypothetical protein